ncbi:MAG: hypothetical protein OPY06_01385 [Nitrosopumilus sp.]|nr:hypothetical protein [Nitrosopumilus sp.]
MIVINNNSGIGNKLKNVASALRRGTLENDLVVLGFPHEDIFTIKQTNTETKQERIDYTTWAIQFFSHNYDEKFLKENKKFIVVGDENQTWTLDNMIDFQYHNIQSYIIEDYLKYFNAIQFDHELFSLVDQTVEKFDIENCVGVHIRSWTDDPPRNRLLHNMSMFVEEMNMHNENFFLCSDSEFCVNQLKKEFVGRVLSQEIKNERHIAFTPSREARVGAFVDMLLLSRCKKIIGTYQSTFTEAAWWFGQCKQEVIIPIPEHVRNLYGE